MEADLQRFYGVDYRDRWRDDEHGRPRLTLRRLAVLVTHLPPDSAVGRHERDGKAHWSLEAHLLDDVRTTFAAAWSEKGHTPKPHPERPLAGRKPAADPGRVAEIKRRARRRRERIACGEIT